MWMSCGWVCFFVTFFANPPLAPPRRGMFVVDGGEWWWLVVVGYNHPVLRTPLYFDFAQYKLWRGISHVDGGGFLWLVVVLLPFEHFVRRLRLCTE